MGKCGHRFTSSIKPVIVEKPSMFFIYPQNAYLVIREIECFVKRKGHANDIGMCSVAYLHFQIKKGKKIKKKKCDSTHMNVEIFTTFEDFKELYMHLSIMEGGVHERNIKKKIPFIRCGRVVLSSMTKHYMLHENSIMHVTKEHVWYPSTLQAVKFWEIEVKYMGFSIPYLIMGTCTWALTLIMEDFGRLFNPYK